MAKNGFLHQLPVPNISDHLSHSFKQYDNHKNNSFNRLIKKPPKLFPKYENSFNRSLNSSTAHAISFKESSLIGSASKPTELLSAATPSSVSTNGFGNCPSILMNSIHYVDKNESYFEQCFENISKIGEGSFGEVFRVRSKDDGQLYAVKKSKHLLRSKQYRLERLEEVRRYEEFSQHEHCVRLYRAWQQNDCLYMQMELCRCSLEAYVAEKKTIPEPMVWSILLDLLLALKSLHDKNLIHLDIKLDNILIGDYDMCKLADFGLVVDLNRKDLHLATEGDSRYVAPEIMRGDFSKAADIFSLGISVLELACNLELPQNGPLWQDLRNGIFPQEFNCMLSINLQSLIRRMMYPDRHKRPDVDELLIYPKLHEMLRMRRSNWNLIRKFRIFLVTVKRFFDQKLCNFRIKVSNFLKLQHKRRRQDEADYNLLVHGNSPSKRMKHSTPNENPEDFDCLLSANIAKPLEFDCVVNSTPLNRFSQSRFDCRQIRKELTRSQLNFDSSEEDDIDIEFNKLSDSPTLERSDLSSSSIICKKLNFKETP